MVGRGLEYQNKWLSTSARGIKRALESWQLKKRWLLDSSSELHSRQVGGIGTPHPLNFMKVFKCPHLTLHSRMDNLVGIWDQIPSASWSLWLLALIPSQISPRFLHGDPDLHNTVSRPAIQEDVNKLSSCKWWILKSESLREAGFRFLLVSFP